MVVRHKLKKNWQFSCQVCYFQHNAAPHKTKATSKESSCQSEFHCRFGIEGAETFLTRHWNKSQHHYWVAGRGRRGGLGELETSEKRPVCDLCVPKCDSLPADFDPVKWNSGGQRVLHLNQKLEGRDGWKDVSLMIKHTCARTSDHRCDWVIHPIRAINLLPPVSHRRTHTHTHRWYLLSGDGSVVQRGGLQRHADFFAVLVNVIDDFLDLFPPFPQHREVGKVWEELRLISWPPQTNTKRRRKRDKSSNAACLCVRCHHKHTSIQFFTFFNDKTEREKPSEQENSFKLQNVFKN